MDFAKFTVKELRKLINVYKEHVKFSDTAPSKMKRDELLHHIHKHFTYDKKTGHIMLRMFPELSISEYLVKNQFLKNITHKDIQDHNALVDEAEQDHRALHGGKRKRFY